MRLIVEAPIFHVAPPQGWVNDPNGPLFYNGRYHLFYQHLSSSSSWAWGLSWGHASSSNLVHWTRHPPALNPNPQGFDCDGCFSGCAVVLPAADAAAAGLKRSASPAGNAQHSTASPAAATAQARGDAMTKGGVPVLMYTGVVLRPDRDPAVRPSSLAVSELCIERQLAAVAADAGDPFLLQWHKLPGSWLTAPPPGLCLNCFRDPFILERPSPSNGSTWKVMIGAGIRQPGTGLACAGNTAAAAADVCGRSTGMAAAGCVSASAAGAAAAAAAAAAAGAATDAAAAADPRRAARGTALVYSSKQLLSGWQYEGQLCAASRPEQGLVWECPVLAALPLQHQAPGQQGNCSSLDATAAQAACSNLFSISGGFASSSGTGCIYWLGRYVDGKFDLAAAAGPTRLDLGDILYAPNLLTVPAQDGSSRRRLLLWGWLPELPGRQQQPRPDNTPPSYAGTTSLPCQQQRDNTELPGCQQQPRPDNNTAQPSYAGAISLPRQLLLSPEGHLLQQPLPELALLHTGPALSVAELQLQPCVPRRIGGSIPSSYFNLELTLLPAAAAAANCSSGTGSCSAGIILPAWTTPNHSSSSSRAKAAGEGAVLLYDFDSSTLMMTVGLGVGAELLALPDTAPASAAGMATAATPSELFAKYNPAGPAAAAAAADAAAAGAGSSGCSSARLPNGVRQLQGNLRLAAGQPQPLRLLLDYSLLEVFCGDGQVMSTRLYPGVWPNNSSSSCGAAAASGQITSDAHCSSIEGLGQALGAAALMRDAAPLKCRQDCSSVPAAVVSNTAQFDASQEEACANAQNAARVPNEGALAGAAAPCSAASVPQGVYLLAFGSSAVATGVSMHAMGSAWEGH